MNHYKVYVYAICKNEALFAERWMKSMGEADGIYVLDTGSTDGTPALLRSLGAKVSEAVISPWRFDVARNRSLSLLPQDADICVCTDLDEIFQPGWRKKIEEIWKKGAGQAIYRFAWCLQPDGSEGILWIRKIHCRHGYIWVNPVHEVLQWQGSSSEPPAFYAEGVRLEHHPDPAKSRSQYLPLLELAVAEDPESDRNMHYLGREYLYYGQWDRCIQTLQRHLKLKSAVWADERCASMRYIARAYWAQKNTADAEIWFLRAVAEAPHLREPWMEFARLAYEEKNWDLLLWLTGRALAITERPRTYITEADSWGSLPHDLASLAYYYTGRYSQALEQIKLARAFSPKDPRLEKNQEWIEKCKR